MARFHEVWVITRKCEKKEIVEELKLLKLENIRWIFHDLPGCEELVKEGGRGVHFYYYLWQMTAYQRARNIAKAFSLNIAHHLTYGGYWMPSFLVYLPVPFLWGPVGGAESPPTSFSSKLDFRFRFFEKIRKTAQRIGEKDPSLKRCIKGAAVALAKTEETGRRLNELGASCVQLCSESGLSREEIEQLGKIPANISRPFRFISMGRLLNWKQFDLGLKAYASVHQKLGNCEYWILGDGPECLPLKQLARDLGIQKTTRFFGQISRGEVLKKLAFCHVLVHPSLHDSGGWVCLEAMAAGRPVVCLNLGGPALQVTEKTGFRIKTDTPEQVVENMSRAFLTLSWDEKLYQSMSTAGRRRIRDHFEWNKKGEGMNALYHRIVDERKKNRS